MGAERWDEQVGSVADEAARLLESLRRTASDAAGDDAPADDAAAGGVRGPRVHEGDHGHRAATDGADDSRPGCDDPFCQWCPLCRTSAVVRSLSPETLARLADLAGVAAAVLADLASARSRDTASAEDAPHAPPSPSGGPRRAPAQPIPVRDDDAPTAADAPEEA